MIIYMKQLKTALFDFDGVVVDTEPIYDLFWNDAAKRYGLGIDNFADIIKGTTLPYILEKYFSGYTEEFRQMVTKESTEYEKTMPLPPMPGSIEFIRMLKEHGVQIGLVTSSDNAKVKRAFGLLHLDNLFDTLVTADRITQGKPDPMCYLLAAKDLNVSPEDCIVFEDSFNGIQSGKASGATVIGLATTNSREDIAPLCHYVLDDFQGFTYDKLTQLHK